MESRDGRGLSEEVLAEARALLAEFERRSLEGDIEAAQALAQVSTVH
jgi:hypothetical protein